jgi:hypothetical protein
LILKKTLNLEVKFFLKKNSFNFLMYLADVKGIFLKFYENKLILAQLYLNFAE